MSESTALLSTRLLRESDDPLYSRLREVLPDQGVDVSTCILANLFPDDGHIEFGVLVDLDHRVFTFELHYGGGDLVTQAATARIVNWRDITESWHSSLYSSSVQDALGMFDPGARQDDLRFPVVLHIPGSPDLVVLDDYMEATSTRGNLARIRPDGAEVWRVAPDTGERDFWTSVRIDNGTCRSTTWAGWGVHVDLDTGSQLARTFTK